MNIKKVTTIFVIAFLVTMAFPPLSQNAEAQPSIEDKLEPWLLDKIVKLESNRTSQIMSLTIGLVEVQSMAGIETLKTTTTALLVERHNAKQICITPVLPFLTAKVNSTEVRAIAAYKFVKLLGDGERPFKPELDVSTQTVHASYVWRNLNYNGSGKIIAIIDIGMNETHPGLVGKVIDHIDYTGTGFGDPSDHGTHVAGIAAGTGAGSPVGSFYPGVAFGAWLLNVKVSTANDVVNGIGWAVQHNANIISMSGGLGTNCNCPQCNVCGAVKGAVERGVVFVKSAGNAGPGAGSITCPGCSEEAITVGAINDLNTPSIHDDSLMRFSSRGPTLLNKSKPDVVAPGGDPFNIMSPNNMGGYSAFGRTSAAAPHIAGVAALILQAHPKWTPAMVKSAIKATANLNDILQPLTENDRGKGIVDATRAISCSTEIPPDQAESKYENYWGNAGAIAYLNGTFRIWAAGTVGGDARAEARLNKTFTPSHNMSNPTFFLGFHDIGYMESDLGYATFFATLKLWQGDTILASTEEKIHQVDWGHAYDANCSHAIQLTYQGKLLAGQQYKLDYGFWTFAHVAWSNFYDVKPSAGITALHLTAIDTVGVGNPSFEERVFSVYESWYWANNRQGWRNVRGDLDFDGDCDGDDFALFIYYYNGHYDWHADFDGDGDIDGNDLSIFLNSYNYDVLQYLDGIYSWFTNGGGDYTISQWLCDHDVNAMKGHNINFTFCFKPETVAPNARAEIRYVLDNGTDRTINGDWVCGTQITWYNASIKVLLPANTIAIKIIIHGTPNFKAWIDKTSIIII